MHTHTHMQVAFLGFLLLRVARSLIATPLPTLLRNAAISINGSRPRPAPVSKRSYATSQSNQYSLSAYTLYTVICELYTVLCRASTRPCLLPMLHTCGNNHRTMSRDVRPAIRPLQLSYGHAQPVLLVLFCFVGRTTLMRAYSEQVRASSWLRAELQHARILSCSYCGMHILWHARMTQALLACLGAYAVCPLCCVCIQGDPIRPGSDGPDLLGAWVAPNGTLLGFGPQVCAHVMHTHTHTHTQTHTNTHLDPTHTHKHTQTHTRRHTNTHNCFAHGVLVITIHAVHQAAMHVYGSHRVDACTFTQGRRMHACESSSTWRIGLNGLCIGHVSLYRASMPHAIVCNARVWFKQGIQQAAQEGLVPASTGLDWRPI